MKTLFSLPKDKDFFNRYATLVPTLNILGHLAQVVSALTEIGVIYLLIFSSLAGFFPVLAFPVAFIGCVIGTAFIEVGLRKFTPYSVRAILHNRFQGLDRIMSVFVLAACLLLLGASGFLSFKGSKTIVEAVAPPPAMITTASADSTASAAKAETMAQYRADSIGIASRHAAQAQALKTSAASAIAAGKMELRNIEAKERATGQPFGTQKREARKRIADMEATRDAQLAQLEADKANALASLTADRKSAAQRIEANHSARRDSVTTYNATAIEQAANQVKNYGGGLAWFTVVCLVVFILSVALNEVHAKGSGIEEVPQPNQYHFSESITAEFMNAASERINYNLRSKIRRWADLTPEPMEPKAPPVLYELADTAQPRRKIGVQNPNKSQVLQTTQPVPLLEQLRQQGSQNTASPGATNNRTGTPDAGTPCPYEQQTFALIQQAATAPEADRDALELSALDVVALYLGKPANDPAVRAFFNRCRDYLQGKGQNPFAEHRAIIRGFVRDNASISNSTIITDGQQATKHSLDKDCIQCGTPFRAKVAWQKFCSAECKEAHHTEKHGAKFNPKQYHQKAKV